MESDEQPTTTATDNDLAHHTPLVNLPSAGLKELPTRFEECDIEHLIDLIASMLTRLINHNDQIPFTSTSLTRFHSRSPPAITISDYLRRIYKYTNPEPICLILILNYIDRICKNLINFTICSLTVHRFCITSVTVGSKFICDSFYSNSRYAKVGGISLTEINLLEREFLLAIDYRLSTTNEELNKYYLSLVESHPSYKIDNRTTSTSNQQRAVQPMVTSRMQEDGEDEESKGKSEQQDEETRKSKRLRGKDEEILLDPQTNPVENPPPEEERRVVEPPQEDDKDPPRPHHQQHSASSAPNVLPDSIIED